jgi:hypothetical protein
VTQPFLIRLMREEWVQRNYYVSDGSLGYSLKPYYGQLILSKLPFHRCFSPFSPFVSCAYRVRVVCVSCACRVVRVVR